MCSHFFVALGKKVLDPNGSSLFLFKSVLGFKIIEVTPWRLPLETKYWVLIIPLQCNLKIKKILLWLKIHLFSTYIWFLGPGAFLKGYPSEEKSGRYSIKQVIKTKIGQIKRVQVSSIFIVKILWKWLTQS